MNRVVLVFLLILLPLIIIFASITIWNIKTKNASDRQREDVLTKIAITGTVVTTTALVYMIFNINKL